MKYVIKHAGFAEYEAGLADTPEFAETFDSYAKAKERETVLQQYYEFCKCDRVSKEDYVKSNENERAGIYYILIKEER